MPVLDRPHGSIRYDVTGAGPPLLLTHGYGATSGMFSQNLDALSAGNQVITWDIRGHGSSESPDGPDGYGAAAALADMTALLDELGHHRVILGGHSLGAAPAYLYTARHPARVARLILEEPPPPWPRAPRVLTRPADAEALPFDWAATALSNQFTDPPVSAWRDALGHIQAPALLIAGGPGSHIDQDQLADLAALIPHCELVTIPAGHLVHGARPAEFNAAVTSFLT
jgi:3-oxoadipate enol-lactonase